MSVSGEVIEGFRLSLGQAALWRSAEGGKDRRVGGVVSVDGPLEEDLLRRALTEVVSAHEILRTCPRVMPALRLPLQTVEDAEVSWRDYGSARNGERPAGTLVRRHAAEADPDARVRAGLLRIGPAEHLLVLDLPRLIADPRTVAAVVSETQRAYQALLIGAEVPRPEVQFVQFSEWQHALTGAKDEAAAEAFAYWRRQPLPSPATSLAGWRSAVPPAAPPRAQGGGPGGGGGAPGGAPPGGGGGPGGPPGGGAPPSSPRRGGGGGWWVRRIRR
jgi:hypothetical protein